MKRSILFFGFLYLLSIASVFAQKVDRFEINLTVPGSLKDSLTVEQQKDVVYLILSGVMNKDDFYFIRDNLLYLKELDLKDIALDTIPEKAFLNCPSNFRCILPQSLKAIGERALENTGIKILISGKFPNIKADIWGEEDPNNIFLITEDNTECKIVNNDVYSADEKVFYFHNYGRDVVAEGVEVIECRAFYKQAYFRMELPSTLKLIKEYAFAYVRPQMRAGWDDYENDLSITIHADTPPFIESHNFEEVSEEPYVFTIQDAALYVPQGKVEAYRKADPQWSEFKYILDIGSTHPDSIQKNAYQPFSIQNDGKSIRIDSSQPLSKIQLIHLTGISCYSQKANNENLIIPNQFPHGTYILKITLQNGDSYAEKLNL